jgi:hypothetical protein
MQAVFHYLFCQSWPSARALSQAIESRLHWYIIKAKFRRAFYITVAVRWSCVLHDFAICAQPR